MSHIVTIQVEVRDLEAIKSAACQLNLKEPIHGKAVVFDTEIEGILVKLPDWIYPVVCILDSGELKYDYTGSTCREASRFLEDALGVGTVEHLKTEYFLDENHNLQHKERIQY